jgi:hypothetical protein
MAFIDVEVPRVGDLADHKSGELDSRRVCEVEERADGVVLCVFLEGPSGSPMGPFNAGNYTYKRKVV